MNTIEECSTKSGKRNHYREPGADLTFCSFPAIDKITDQAHRSDAVCHRCVVVRDWREAKEGTT